MSIPRPKFCVGEVVDIVAYESGRLIFERVAVLSALFEPETLTKEGYMSTWVYETSEQENDLPYVEIMLRKRREDDNWQNIREIWVPKGEIA